MMNYKIEYMLTRLVGFFAKIVPQRVAFAIGDLIGSLFFYVIRTRRKVALQNLIQCFGSQKSEQELRKILLQNYRHFGRVLMEFARMPLLKRATILEQIPVHNIEYLREFLNQDRGLFVMSGHFGNWEYLAAAIANVGPQLYCIFKEQKNLAVDNVIKKFRTDIGLIPFKVRGEAAKGILKVLREKGVVLIVNDQDAGRKGEMIDFLGKPASTSRGPALIAIKHRVPVIMAFGVREKDGSIRVHLEKFPDIEQFTNDEHGVRQFLIEYNKVVAQYIRKYPEQWFWMHRRWKTQQTIGNTEYIAPAASRQ